MKRSISILSKLGLLLVALLMGWLAGEWLARAEEKGMFVQWELIDTPPEKATKIVAAETIDIYVSTSEGNVYQCGYHTTECRETSKPIQLIERPCGEVLYQPPYMPDEVVASTEATDCRMFRTQTNYVIRKDGSVWAWGPRQLVF
jgi:alpha-tubulin suppressor-like RCC1 family protein